MKSVCLLLGAAMLSAASAPPAATLRLQVQGLKPRGQVLVALYDSEKSWNAKAGAVRELRLPVAATSTSFTLEGLAPGQYGAMIFQDLNKDGKMNFNLVGMPLEPYGFSNNSRGLFGPPAWEAAAFRLGGTAAHAVRVR
jgi:uncharacterized protein (DUF2141 family)